MLIPIMLGVIVIVFLIRAVTPGDPIDHLLSEDAPEEKRTELRHSLGLDRSLPVQFILYVRGVLTGDLGTSYVTKQPVLKEILERMPTTFAVCFGAVFLGMALGVPLGIISSQKPYSALDSVILVISMIARSVPGFCLAFVLINIFSVNLHWLPAVGISNKLGYIMPMMTIGLASMANYTRITRSSMLEIVKQDYVRTARAKGQSERGVIFGHELRNASIPIAATLGNQVGHQLGGALIIETVFGVPGIGKYIGDAVSARNFPAIQGGVLFLAFVFTLVNLLVDLSFIAINPRLKTSIIKTGGKSRRKAACPR